MVFWCSCACAASRVFFSSFLKVFSEVMSLSESDSAFHTSLCFSVRCAAVCLGARVFEYLFVFGEKMWPFAYRVLCACMLVTAMYVCSCCGLLMFGFLGSGCTKGCISAQTLSV